MVLQGKHVMGVKSVWADGITRWNGKGIQPRLTNECPAVPWQAQELGVERARMCSEIAHSDALGASCEVDSKDSCARLENVGELKDHEKEWKLVGE